MPTPDYITPEKASALPARRGPVLDYYAPAPAPAAPKKAAKKRKPAPRPTFAPLVEETKVDDGMGGSEPPKE